MLKEFINTCLLANSRIFILGFALFFASCGKNDGENVEIPANILNEERFTKLLTDYSLAESASNMNIKSVPLAKMDTVYAFNPLIDNNVRKSQYDSTVAFYVRNPALYKKVYENVLTALTEMQTSREATTAVRDSK